MSGGGYYGTPYYYPGSAYYPRASYPYYYDAPYRVPETTRVQADPGNSAALVGEEVEGNAVRLTWRGDSRSVSEVGLFLADTGQKVLAVQTVRTEPFTALFDRNSAAAYIGMTVVYADGRQTTTLLPYTYARP